METERLRHDGSKMWYAITTKYKCEKYVAGVVARMGIESYVPLLRRTKRYTRKIKRYEVPLISCYAFVRIDLRERVRVLEVPYVHQFVHFDGRIMPVPDHEMQVMRRIVGEIADVVAEPRAWAVGDEVEIIAGSLTGIRGRLVEQSGKHEFVVDLESLGYQLRMIVDARMLQRIRRPGFALAL